MYVEVGQVEAGADAEFGLADFEEARADADGSPDRSVHACVEDGRRDDQELGDERHIPGAIGELADISGVGAVFFWDAIFVLTNELLIDDSRQREAEAAVDGLVGEE